MVRIIIVNLEKEFHFGDVTFFNKVKAERHLDGFTSLVQNRDEVVAIVFLKKDTGDFDLFVRKMIYICLLKGLFQDKLVSLSSAEVHMSKKRYLVET